MPAPLPRPHTVWVGTVYPGSTTSIGRDELHTNHDTSTLAVTLGATTTLVHTSELVITIMRRNTSLAQLFGLWSAVIDPSRSDPRDRSLRTGIRHPTGFSPWLESSVRSLKHNNVRLEVIGRSSLEWDRSQRTSAVVRGH